MTLDEMLEYGPIIHSDPELGLYITVNGSYQNVWTRHEVDSFENIDAYSNSEWNPFQKSLGKVVERAEKLLAEISAPDEDMVPPSRKRR